MLNGDLPANHTSMIRTQFRNETTVGGMALFPKKRNASHLNLIKTVMSSIAQGARALHKSFVSTSQCGFA
jgi:hypothetical protein